MLCLNPSYERSAPFPPAQVLKVCVTGAAGQIAYSLLYSIANGEVFGKDQVSSASAVGSSVTVFCLAADCLNSWPLTIYCWALDG